MNLIMTNVKLQVFTDALAYVSKICDREYIEFVLLDCVLFECLPLNLIVSVSFELVEK